MKDVDRTRFTGQSLQSLQILIHGAHYYRVLPCKQGLRPASCMIGPSFQKQIQAEQ